MAPTQSKTGGLFASSTFAPAVATTTTNHTSFEGFASTAATPLFEQVKEGKSLIFERKIKQAHRRSKSVFGCQSNSKLSNSPHHQGQANLYIFNQSIAGKLKSVNGDSDSISTTYIEGDPVKFTFICGHDTMQKNGICHDICTKLHCITCMSKYQKISLEELRLDDYLAGRGASVKEQQTFGSSFGNSATVTSFNSNAHQSIFSNNTDLFKSTSTDKFLFDASKVNSTFGTPSTKNVVSAALPAFKTNTSILSSKENFTNLSKLLGSSTGTTFDTTGTIKLDSTLPVFSRNTSAFFSKSIDSNPGQLFGNSTSKPTFCTLDTKCSTTGGLFEWPKSTPSLDEGGTFSRMTGTPAKFTFIWGRDTMQKNGICHNICTRLHCITCMSEYQKISLEELRLDDYLVGRGASVKEQQTFGSSFGNSATVTSFNSNAHQSIFNNTDLFKSISTDKFLFEGSKVTSTFGAPSTKNVVSTALPAFKTNSSILSSKENFTNLSKLLGSSTGTTFDTTGTIKLDSTLPAFNRNTSAFFSKSIDSNPGELFGNSAIKPTFCNLATKCSTTGGLFECSKRTPSFDEGGTLSTMTGTPAKFTFICGHDTMLKDGICHDISTRFHCITCMREYEKPSLEKLRFENYLAARGGHDQIQSPLFAQQLNKKDLNDTSLIRKDLLHKFEMDMDFKKSVEEKLDSVLKIVSDFKANNGVFTKENIKKIISQEVRKDLIEEIRNSIIKEMQEEFITKIKDDIARQVEVLIEQKFKEEILKVVKEEIEREAGTVNFVKQSQCKD